MKKSIIASIISLGLISGYASANNATTGSVEFIGSVTASTCNVDAVPTDGGFNAKSSINLGSVKVGETGAPKMFSIKATNPAEDGCVALSKMNSATIRMSSGAFTKAGLGITSGSAKDAYVKLDSSNAKNNVSVTSATKDQGVKFDASKLITDGFQFKATLQGGKEKGDFRTATNFTIDYQ
ncbi:fimbrial protein [Escherichia coli]